KSAVYSTVTRTMTGVAFIAEDVANAASDTLTFSITDAETNITTGTEGSPLSTDTVTFSIDDTSTLTTTTVTDNTTADMLTFSIPESGHSIPVRAGERVDPLPFTITEGSSLSISSAGAGSADPAIPPVIHLASPRAHDTIDNTNATGAYNGVFILADTLVAA